jgi:hypothetical protein
VAAGVVLKHKRKAGNFANGELAAGEIGLNTNSGAWFYSADGLTSVQLTTKIETRTSDPASPAVGDIWLRTDL